LLLLPGPKLLHIHTVKGRGYLAAEQDPVGYHAIDKIDPIAKAPSPKAATYANIFGQWACHVAAQDSRLQVITPAMAGGSGLSAFASQFPKQLHDVAIAEQHAVTLAAGMACAGAKPVVAIYSTFLQRGYDQLVHDVALQNLDVLFAVDRAGVVGEDGATHTGAYDIGYLSCVPNLVLMAPSSAQEAISLLQLGYDHSGPAVVRYPRGVAIEGLPVVDINMGESHLLRKGSKVAILNFGALLPAAVEVAASLDATLVDMRFIKPLDSNRLEQLLDHNIWVTLEDHAITGGAGGLVAQWLAQQTPAKYPKLINLGLPDKVLAHATREQVLADSGLTATDIEKTIQAALAV
jgi:1-deoxy-D-xylulose-5-phosphate synthase